VTDTDFIPPAAAVTLPGLFRERVRRSPNLPAYRFFDALNGAWIETSWAGMARDVGRWQAALAEEGLKPGERVAVMARNSRFWVAFEQAALGLGLVVVPVYTEDRGDNVGYIIEHSEVRLLVIGGAEQWQRLAGHLEGRRSLKRIISVADVDDANDKRLQFVRDWLPREFEPVKPPDMATDDLATIVYTSGTTGRPKGVMLSHRNILSNAWACLQVFPVEPRHVFLSFLPLSHTLERTVGYYLPMMAGASVAHARSIPDLPQDLRAIRPDGLISVPRIYERVYSRIKESLSHQKPVARFLFRLAVDSGWNRFECGQGRGRPGLLWPLWPVLKRLVADKITARLGGNIQVAVSGGAALSPEIGRTFIGLGIPILQGYGLTEASPVVSVNRPDDNVPASIGPPLPGVEVRIGPDDELLVRGENVMLGFWKDPEATARMIDEHGWLHTGDKARIENGHIFITGRIKEIIVLANGEKVSPMDMEIAIASDPLFDQVMIVGEGRPFLSALVVLNEAQWRRFAKEHGITGGGANSEQARKLLLDRIAACLHEFPGYAKVVRVAALNEPWTVDNGMLTPTMKGKRSRITEKYSDQIERMYAGHSV
jgi:long-chain acyl-CoA synthetase